MNSEKKAVFICGCPRSGTTFLGSLLGNGVGCITTPESQYIIEIAARISTGNVLNKFLDIKNALLNNFRFGLWDINQEIQNIPDSGHPSTLLDMVWQSIDIYASKTSKKPWHTWIDHTPENINHINFLRTKFVNSYFIHIVRDGRGVFSSVKPLDWGPNGIIRGAQWWVNKVAPGLAAEHAFGKQITRVHFENLVLEPEKELKRICEFIDIPFNPSMVKGDGYVIPKYTKNQHKLVGRPPDKSICNKWRNSLSPREIEIFESISGVLLEYLGYNLQYDLTAEFPTRWERYQEMYIFEIVRRFSNRWHRYLRNKNI